MVQTTVCSESFHLAFKLFVFANCFPSQIASNKLGVDADPCFVNGDGCAALNNLLFGFPLLNDLICLCPVAQTEGFSNFATTENAISPDFAFAVVIRMAF